MKRLIRTSLAAATAAAALAASPALAHDRDDCDRHPAPVAYPAYPAPAPAPVYAPVRVPVYAPAPAPVVVVRPARWNRGQEWRELRQEYRRLDAARDRFYASWHGNGWRRDRFESWYASRRAELDHRSAELSRGRGHWDD